MEYPWDETTLVGEMDRAKRQFYHSEDMAKIMRSATA
jgi:hypothetical protein